MHIYGPPNSWTTTFCMYCKCIFILYVILFQNIFFIKAVAKYCQQIINPLHLCVILNNNLCFIKSPKQSSLGDLLFLIRFLLLLLLFLFLLLLFFFSFFSFLSLAHELVHGRSQELLDRIS